MLKYISYIEVVVRNKKQRLKGILFTFYLRIHGCKVGKGLKCANFPYIKGFLNKNITIGDYVDLGRNNTFELSGNGHIFFGDYVLLHQNILISCNSKITFGKFAGVAENVSIRDGNHQFEKNKYFRLQECLTEAIEIGEDTGIAAGCVIMMGSKIPKGVFIGANSIVSRKNNLEEYGIYAGNPLKLISIRK